MKMDNKYLPKMKLTHASVFYRNDSRNGIGRTFEANSELRHGIKESIKGCKKLWKASKEEERKQIVKSYFKQLDQLAELGAEGKEKEIDQSYYVIALVNVWFLENHGFLESDEYNGCLFTYEN